MGSLIQQQYTISLPDGAKIKGDQVTWTSRGKTKTGTLSGPDRVTMRSGVWLAQYTDETGKQKRVATGCRDKAAANKFLVKLENEVARIRAGVMTREEINQSQSTSVPIEEHIGQFRIKMVAAQSTAKHIKSTLQKINDLFAECRIATLKEVDRRRIEGWIASGPKAKPTYLPKDGSPPKEGLPLTPRSINSYLVAANSFLNWAVENKLISENPLKVIKKLNEEIGRKKKRRSLTESELTRLFEAAQKRKYRRKNKAEEHILIYRLLVGTGLRSTELSLATPSQFDFERNRFTVEAVATKNKRPDVLPIRPDLAKMLKEWIDRFEIQPNKRIFSYDKHSIRRSFYCDLAAAGIERIGPDGRSLDVHSLRRTFGTMLARGGVPLTTTQRLMRHSTPELTAKLYIDVEPIDMMEAVDKLPNF